MKRGKWGEEDFSCNRRTGQSRCIAAALYSNGCNDESECAILECSMCWDSLRVQTLRHPHPSFASDEALNNIDSSEYIDMKTKQG